MAGRLLLAGCTLAARRDHSGRFECLPKATQRVIHLKQSTLAKFRFAAKFSLSLMFAAVSALFDPRHLAKAFVMNIRGGMLIIRE